MLENRRNLVMGMMLTFTDSDRLHWTRRPVSGRAGPKFCKKKTTKPNNRREIPQTKIQRRSSAKIAISRTLSKPKICKKRTKRTTIALKSQKMKRKSTL